VKQDIDSANWRKDMGVIKNLWIAFLVMAIGVGCNYLQVPVREYQLDDKLAISSRIPQRVERGKEFEFVVITEMNSNCFSGVKYLTIQNEWKTVDFPAKVADQSGKCSWLWKIPLDAKSGMAEYRAYVAKGEKTAYSLPDDFCIDICQ
jgi:hypothetical protein